MHKATNTLTAVFQTDFWIATLDLESPLTHKPLTDLVPKTFTSQRWGKKKSHCATLKPTLTCSEVLTCFQSTRFETRSPLVAGVCAAPSRGCSWLSWRRRCWWRRWWQRRERGRAAAPAVTRSTSASPWRAAAAPSSSTPPCARGSATTRWRLSQAPNKVPPTRGPAPGHSDQWHLWS